MHQSCMAFFCTYMTNIIGNFETVWHSLTRKEMPLIVPYQIIFKLHDGDFLELDFYEANSKNLLFIFHGLEASSNSDYVVGLANLALQENLNVIAVNFRGCGKKTNKLFKSYHSGATEDLTELIQHYEIQFESLHAVGFSLGANVLLKYLGENPKNPLSTAVAVSTPLLLKQTVDNLENDFFGIYQKHFLKKLKTKLIRKSEFYPDRLKARDIQNIESLRSFDDYYTAPAHGFKNAQDYYEKCSSAQFLKHIKTPTLIINALNDPFYGGVDYDAIKRKTENPYITWSLPKFGGHVGFGRFFKKGYFHEEQIMFFWERFLK